MAFKLEDIKCPHLKQTPPRSPVWSFILGDDHRLLLCRECMNLIVGTVVQSTIDEGIQRAAKRLLRT